MYWTCGSGRIELKLTRAQAAACSHPGPCDADVLALSQCPAVARQLRKLKPEDLAAELGEFGAWNATELQDHAQNLQRVLWIAAGDITEGNV